jgi:hypothetical protein
MVAWSCCLGPVVDNGSWEEPVVEKGCSPLGGWEREEEEELRPNIPFKGTTQMT